MTPTCCGGGGPILWHSLSSGFSKRLFLEVEWQRDAALEALAPLDPSTDKSPLYGSQVWLQTQMPFSLHFHTLLYQGHNSIMNAKLSRQRFWSCHQSKLVKTIAMIAPNCIQAERWLPGLHVSLGLIGLTQAVLYFQYLDPNFRGKMSPTKRDDWWRVGFLFLFERECNLILGKSQSNIGSKWSNFWAKSAQLQKLDDWLQAMASQIPKKYTEYKLASVGSLHQIATEIEGYFCKQYEY